MAALIVAPANGRVVLRFPAVCKGHVSHPEASRSESVDAVLRRCGGVAIKIVSTDGVALTSGSGSSPAEVFGAELVPGARYTVGYTQSPRTVGNKTIPAVHWDGGSGLEILAREACGVRVETADGSELGAQAIATWMHAGHARIMPPATSSASTAATLSNRWVGDLSALLKTRRLRARSAPAEDGALGPRVLVCSSARGTGKSTAVRTLANYAVRDGYHPLLISASLDGAFPGVAPPTMVGSTVVQYAIPADDDGALFMPSLQTVVGLETTRGGALVEPSSEPSASPAMDGHLFSPNDEAHRGALMHAMRALLGIAEGRTVEFDRTRCGGILVDAPPDDGSDGYVELLLALIEECGIDMVIFVGGSASLRSRLRTAAMQQRKRHRAEAAAASGAPMEVTVGVKAPLDADAPEIAIATSHSTLVMPHGDMIDCFHVPALTGTVARMERDRRAAERSAWTGYFMGSAATKLQPVAVSLFSLLRGSHHRPSANGGGEAAAGAVAFVRLLARSSAALDGMMPIGEEESAAGRGATVSAQQLDDEELLRLLQGRIEGASASAHAVGNAASNPPTLGVATLFLALAAHVPYQRCGGSAAQPQLALGDLDAIAERPQTIGAVAIVPAGRSSSGTEWKVISPSPLPFAEAAAGAPAGADGAPMEPVLCFYVLEGAHGGAWVA